MNENKTTRYFKYAIGEIILVVIGILIALQINNWNTSRMHAQQEQQILKKLAIDMENDITLIQAQIENGKTHTNDYKFCLDALSNKTQPTLEEFNEHFSSSMVMITFNLNRITFSSNTDSRTIDYIQNNNLVDSLNVFYNTNYKGWDDANKEYTRNVIGPYLMKYNYLPIIDYDRFKYNSGGFEQSDFTEYDLSMFEIEPKSISDFKKDIFIINLLRQRLFLTEGQIKYYKKLKGQLERLSKQIQNEITS